MTDSQKTMLEMLTSREQLMEDIGNESDLFTLAEELPDTEDLLESESFSQFGGKKGIGAEHMIVCMVDRILKLLETTEGKAAVIKKK